MLHLFVCFRSICNSPKSVRKDNTCYYPLSPQNDGKMACEMCTEGMQGDKLAGKTDIDSLTKSEMKKMGELKTRFF